MRSPFVRLASQLVAPVVWTRGLASETAFAERARVYAHLRRRSSLRLPTPLSSWQTRHVHGVGVDAGSVVETFAIEATKGAIEPYAKGTK